MTMKRILRFSIFLAAVSVACHAPSATITKGYTFSTNEQVTAAKLHTLVDSATVSAITGSDITDGSIAAVDLGASSVITAKIQDGAVTAGKLGALAVETAKIATNAVGTAQLATNLDMSAKAMTFGTNQIVSEWISGTNAGPGTAGQVVKLGAGGTIDLGLMQRTSLLSTNLITAKSSAATYAWTPIASLVTTSTSGTVYVEGRVTPVPTVPAIVFVRVRDSATNWVRSSTTFNGAGFDSAWTVAAGGADTLSGAAKTYVLEVASSGVSTAFTNAHSNSGLQAPPVVDGLGMTILQVP